MRTMPSLYEYPMYEETQNPLQYTEQVSPTNRVNKTKACLRAETDGQCQK